MLTVVQLLLDYQADLYQINQRFKAIEVSYLDGLSSSVWHMDEEQINIVLGGIKNLPEIKYVSLLNEEGKVLRKLGDGSDTQIIEKVFVLDYEYEGDYKKLGSLHVSASLTEVYNRIIKKVWIIGASQAIKTFIVSAFILLIIRLLFIKHINTIYLYMQRLSRGKFSESLDLERNSFEGKPDDELGLLVDSINHMKSELDSAQKKLTKELAYRKTIQSEMVKFAHEVGVAEAATGAFHNVNNALTPIDFSVTKISKLVTRNEANIDKKDLEQVNRELSRITKNMKIAKKIISTQQSHAKIKETSEDIDINMLLNEILIMQHTTLTRYNVQVEFTPLKQFYGFGILHQLCNIIINLVKNACEAMEDTDPQERKLKFKSYLESDFAVIEIKDSGCGIAEENLKKMFTRGFTTKKHGHGFGLHYCWLTMKEMGGRLEVSSEGANLGTRFLLYIPAKQSEKVEKSA